MILSFWLLLICVVGIANGPVGMVYFYNSVNGFWNGFLQPLGIYMIANLFDRLFIDEWWVGTCIGYPVLAAVMSGIMQLMK